MKKLTLADLIQGLGGGHPEGMTVPIKPIIDSRKASEGAVFFAFKGERVDGHDYVQDALDKGAVAAVVEREVPVVAPCIDLTTVSTSSSAVAAPVIIRVPDVLQQPGGVRWLTPVLLA